MPISTSNKETHRIRVLFVCLGNICRSPAAEGIFRKITEDYQMSARVHIDSAGTGGWHVGELPDKRMRQAALKRGYHLTHQARQVKKQDLQDFDLILGMDASNVRNLRLLAGDDSILLDKIQPFGTWLGDSHLDIPDPYSGGPELFDNVIDLLEKGLHSLASQLFGLSNTTQRS